MCLEWKAVFWKTRLGTFDKNKIWKMKYSDTDLTEAITILSYFKSIRIYAVMISLLSLLYLGFKVYNNTTGTELYLVYCFTGLIILGSLSVFVTLNNITANIYGISYIIAGPVSIFSIIYYLILNFSNWNVAEFWMNNIRIAIIF